MRRSVLAQHAPAPPPQPPQPEKEDGDFVRRLKERNRKRARNMEKALIAPKSSGWLTKGSAAAAKRAPKWQPKPDPLRPPTPPGKPIKTSLC